MPPVITALLLALVLAPAAHAATPTIHAHRGGPVLAGVPTFPEESMAAFRHAHENLHVVLELDAKLTEDGVPVVIHDPTLDRTTNCTGAVIEHTLAELAACKLDVLGAPNNDLETAPAPEPLQPIATLAEALAYAKAAGATVNLEIKNYPTDQADYDPTPAFANRIMDVVVESGLPAKQLIMQSFTPDNLKVAEQRMPGAEIALLTLAGFEDIGINGAATNGWEWWSPQWPVDAEKIDAAHARGLRVVPYTLNKPAAVKDAVAAGVDAVITDDPLMALRILDTEAPKVSVKPRKLTRRKLVLQVTTSEAGTVDLTARVGRRKAGAASLAFAQPGSRRFTLALKRSGRRVKVVAKAADVAGNKRTVRATAKRR